MAKTIMGLGYQIDVEKLHEHPDNPRKELGDLTELADSIRANGVMQNLLVVPLGNEEDEDYLEEYKVIIGHRRLAAAKLAGLNKVPCVIAEMDAAEQLATMLAENMQRSDLTVYEQAMGIQMMMDLGETAEQVSQRTGISVATVNRRKKLVSLDADGFRDAVASGATLMDLEKTAKIEDEAVRKDILQDFGTPNYNFKVDKILEVQENKRAFDGIVKRLQEAGIVELDEGTEREPDIFYKTVIYSAEEMDKFDPEKLEDGEYFYTKGGYSGNLTVNLYKRDSARMTENEEIMEESARKREQERIRKEQMNEPFRTAAQKRRTYVEEIGEKFIVNHFAIVVDALIKLLKEEYCGDLDISEIEAEKEKNPHKAVMMLIWQFLEGWASNPGAYKNWREEFTENDDAILLYEMLQGLWYDLDDEEQSLLDGSHALYAKPKEDEE
ncbi:chromosome partitioning protein, ParB family [Eubacterium aggregans]|uniref:Chromosome partitioning protein, ParB family n=1 Tax=Eubacterium aggregans TaxID=81409 RepID=A0A1H4BPA9_9FIRM|nr:ParB/RepB/Spo0J family partition protein [Eubacterium aggregans]SEA49979.1 chromosome partitioning protein, ParB family [Eubacterium aggregans]